MRSARPALALVAALSLVSVAACGSADTPSADATASGATVSQALKGMSATGVVDFKTAPKVSLGTLPIAAKSVERKVLTDGAGRAAAGNDVVRFWADVYNGTTGKLIDSGFATGRSAMGLWLGSPNVIPGLAKGLLGARPGERVAFAVPPQDAFGAEGNGQLGVKATDTLVFVADVQSVKPALSSVEGAPTASPAGLPTVEFKDGPSRAPTVVVPKRAAPEKTEQATLVQGSGATVTKGQTLIANYHGVLWRDGSVFDSSWQRGTPSDFPIGAGQVLPAWDKVLVGKKIGSRVLLVVPPADGYGKQGSGDGKITATDTLVFVIDILGAY